jgi:chemotaxis protein MotB
VYDHTFHLEEAPMNQDYDDQGQILVPKKRYNKAPIIAFVALGMAGGLGTYAWTARKQSLAAKAEADRLAGEKASLSDALELHRASSLDLDGKLTVCKEELTTEKTTLADVDKQRTGLDAELTACRSSVKDLKAESAEAKQLLAEFKSVTAKFQKMIDSGKLDVVYRRGQMVVKLPDKILFGSGSAQLSKDGKEAIADVAAILKQMPGRRFTIAGHTDDVPVGPGPFQSNWELSATRAVKVTELLIENGVPAGNLVAAGYGPYDPVASNNSTGGRQKNRRIEIILEPNLKAVPDVIAKQEKKKAAKKK